MPANLAEVSMKWGGDRGMILTWRPKTFRWRIIDNRLRIGSVFQQLLSGRISNSLVFLRNSSWTPKTSSFSKQSWPQPQWFVFHKKSFVNCQELGLNAYGIINSTNHPVSYYGGLSWKLTNSSPLAIQKPSLSNLHWIHIHSRNVREWGIMATFNSFTNLHRNHYGPLVNTSCKSYSSNLHRILQEYPGTGHDSSVHKAPSRESLWPDTSFKYDNSLQTLNTTMSRDAPNASAH